MGRRRLTLPPRLLNRLKPLLDTWGRHEAAVRGQRVRTDAASCKSVRSTSGIGKQKLMTEHEIRCQHQRPLITRARREAVLSPERAEGMLGHRRECRSCGHSDFPEVEADRAAPVLLLDFDGCRSTVSSKAWSQEIGSQPVPHSAHRLLEAIRVVVDRSLSAVAFGQMCPRD